MKISASSEMRIKSNVFFEIEVETCQIKERGKISNVNLFMLCDMLFEVIHASEAAQIDDA